jgi:ATP-dependent RNA helicase RhlE
MKFSEIGLIEPILKALVLEGYEYPTPIQEKSIPILLKGRDLLGSAQTGTGKTAAFAIPIIQQIYLNKNRESGKRRIKALIVTPTRELAIQIGDSFTAYSQFTSTKNTVIFGGVKQGTQVSILHKGIDVLVATPGRLLDLMNQGIVSLRDIEYFVLDEADRMLDMGFIHDIKKIIAKLPSKRQSLFFSATMPSVIVDLSHKILGSHPEKVVIKPEQATAEKVAQKVYFVGKRSKIKLLIHILQTEYCSSVLVFSRTKHGANKIVKLLKREEIGAEAIHGNKSQTARQKALSSFKNGALAVLVATDIAARGIDIEELPLVVNYDLPNIPETYVHRIGRTGRAQASGVAISFCDHEERVYLKDIQKLIKQNIPVIEEHPFKVEEPLEKPSEKKNERSTHFKPKKWRPKNSNRNNQNKNNRGFSKKGSRR